jgi:hypothetical protein
METIRISKGENMRATIKSRTFVLLVVCIFAVALAGVPSFAAASGNTQPLTDQQLLQMYPPSQIQAYRAQFSAILSNMSTIAALTGSEQGQADLATAQSQLQQVSDAVVAHWMASGADLAPLQSAMQKALTVTASQPARLNKAAAGGPLYTTAGFPNATYGSACSGYTSNSDVVFAYTTALDSAKLIWIPLSRACEEVVVALGEGGNTSLLCVIPDEALEAAELVLNEYTVCDGDTDSGNIAGNYARLAYINGQIDQDYQATVSNDNTNTSSIMSNINTSTTNIINNDNTNTSNIVANDNTNKDAIIANDNSNKDAIIANDNSNTQQILSVIMAGQAQQLQMAIENNLSKTNPVIGMFELPAAEGGQLETVAQIVTDTISNLVSAGQSVGSANYYLSLANTYYASGRYKTSYYYYALAYRTATSTWS